LKRVVEYDGNQFVRRLVEEAGARLVLRNGTVLYHCREETDDEFQDRIFKQVMDKTNEGGEDNG
jgi:hypothetical protein